MNGIDPHMSSDEYTEKINELSNGVEEKRQWAGRNDEPFDLYDAVISELEFSEIMHQTPLALSALIHSKYQPEEWMHLVQESGSWDDVIKAMAYDVVKQDIFEELHKRKDDPEAVDYETEA